MFFPIHQRHSFFFSVFSFMYFAWKKQILWNFNDKMFFLICFKLDYFCSGHKSFSYFLYFQHWKVQPCLSRSAQNMCRKFGRWWDLETLRSEMLASDEASCCHVMSTSLTCGSEERFSLCPAFCPADHWYVFFPSIVMLELMYTHFQQTNTKDSRLMASNLFF